MTAFSAELILNSGFETGTGSVPSSWTSTGDSAPNHRYNFAPSITGTYSGALGGSTNSTNNVLSQTIPTVNGGSYQLQFKYGYVGTSGQKLNVSLSNATSISPVLGDLVLPAYASPATYTGTFQATSSSVTLTFTDNVAGNSSIADADIAIDDVSLTGPSPAISAPIFNFNKPAEIFASEVEETK